MNLDSEQLRSQRHEIRGFTLIEALIAMFIVSLALVTVATKVSLSAKIASRTQQSTYGRWVAMNAITELRLKPGLPDTGRSDGDEDMAGQTFRWDLDISNTPVEGLRRVDVSVVSDKRPDEVVYTMSAFVGSSNPDARVRPWGGVPEGDGTAADGELDPRQQPGLPSFPRINPRDSRVQPNQ